jgi:hypothetical protein
MRCAKSDRGADPTRTLPRSVADLLDSFVAEASTEDSTATGVGRSARAPLAASVNTR